MESNYISNPAIKLCVEHIEPGSGEKEVQALWEQIIWTVFPASDQWMNVTKYKQGATEPDNKVMKVIQFNLGYATVDVLVVDLKAPQENVSAKAFHHVTYNLLDDHMGESANQKNTTLFGAVGIGAYVHFYEKELSDSGKLITRQSKPHYVVNDAEAIQEYFEYFKEHIPPTSLSSQSISPTSHGGESSSNLINPRSGDSKAEPSKLPEKYYYVQDKKFFLFDHGHRLQQTSRPKDVWVWNENGWSDTGRTKNWRKWDGENVEYK